MKKLMFLLNSGFALLLNFNVMAVTLKDFRTNYLDQYRKSRTYQTKLDLVKAYEKLDTPQDRQLADRELSTFGISIEKLRKEIAATEAKQKKTGVEAIFNQFVRKFVDQFRLVSRDLDLIISNLSRLVLPQARGLQNIEKQQEFLKQKLNELKRRGTEAVDYANSIAKDVSRDLYNKIDKDVNTMIDMYYTMKDIATNIDQKISEIKKLQRAQISKQKELEEISRLDREIKKYEEKTRKVEEEMRKLEQEREKLR